MADQKSGSLSGLTDQEAQEFHALFMKSFIGFTAVAAVAHLLVWMWRPWLVGGKLSALPASDAGQAVASLLNFVV